MKNIHPLIILIIILLCFSPCMLAQAENPERTVYGAIKSVERYKLDGSKTESKFLSKLFYDNERNVYLEIIFSPDGKPYILTRRFRDGIEVENELITDTGQPSGRRLLNHNSNTRIFENVGSETNYSVEVYDDSGKIQERRVIEDIDNIDGAMPISITEYSYLDEVLAQETTKKFIKKKKKLIHFLTKKYTISPDGVLLSSETIAGANYKKVSQKSYNYDKYKNISEVEKITFNLSGKIKSRNFIAHINRYGTQQSAVTKPSYLMSEKHTSVIKAFSCVGEFQVGIKEDSFSPNLSFHCNGQNYHLKGEAALEKAGIISKVGSMVGINVDAANDEKYRVYGYTIDGFSIGSSSVYVTDINIIRKN